MKLENWNGHEIRFIEKAPGDWWAVAADVAAALGYRNAFNATVHLKEQYKGTTKGSTPSGEQELLTLNEKGLYRLIMRSNKPEAEAFQDWVYDVIKTLRHTTGLEGFEIFRLLDKEHQLEAMAKLHDGLQQAAKIDYIKANTIANKAVSSMYGFPKMVKKGDMTPEMLVSRQPMLDDAVELMSVNDRFKLGVSVSETVYAKYARASV
jgi:prophage antirepressor-like protein